MMMRLADSGWNLGKGVFLFNTNTTKLMFGGSSKGEDMRVDLNVVHLAFFLIEE